MSEVLWIDCETGGTDDKMDALLQLSAIIEIDGGIVDEIDLKMKPVKEKFVNQRMGINTKSMLPRKQIFIAAASAVAMIKWGTKGNKPVK